MLDDSLSPSDRIRHDECVSEQKKDITEMWTQFCNMDPEHFIWGIDPNETPPEVVIKRVVFAPKKSSIVPSEEDKRGKKRKRSKGNKESTSQERRDRERNKSCIVM